MTGGARDAGLLGQLSLWSGEGTEPDWRVRVSERARRMTIRVFAGGRVEIVVPRWARPASIQRFVHQHRDWTRRKVAELSSRAPRAVLPEHIELAATGEQFEVHYRARKGRARLRACAGGASGGVLEVAGEAIRAPAAVADPPAAIADSALAVADQVEVRECLRRWLVDHARERFEPWLRQVSEETGLPFAALQVRRQRTRWGSCSVRGTISLNCCLLFQRPEVVRYLFVHELAHTRHMNHSMRFWRLVASLEPACRHLDGELVQGWQNVPPWVFGL